MTAIGFTGFVGGDNQVHTTDKIMGLKIYKPNKKVTGHACHFELTSTGDGKGVYLNMVKQTGWTNGNGSFKGGDQIKIKFNETEVAGMIDSIESERKLDLFHSSDKTGQTTINFGPYTGKGHSLAVRRGDKTFLMGLTYPERRNLKEWLIFALQRMHQATYTADKKARDAKQ